MRVIRFVDTMIVFIDEMKGKKRNKSSKIVNVVTVTTFTGHIFWFAHTFREVK